MKPLQCPGCSTTLDKDQVILKPTKKRIQVKARCKLCHRAWLAMIEGFYDPQPA